MPTDPDDRWTVGRLLRWTQDFLKKKGSESPRLDAEVLLASVLKCERVRLYTQYEDEVVEPSRTAFRDLVKRRAEGAPVAYLVGKKEFYSLAFAVSPAVLIPRPDSEFVVVEALTRLKGIVGPRCVDVGTGSGCLALAVAHQHKTARFTAIDKSPEALAVARKNGATHGLLDRVVFVEGDLLEPVGEEDPFDLILSNPPYIASAVVPTLEPSVRDFEPHLALDGGEDGLRVVERLIDQALPLLKVGGFLILEIGSDQEAPVRELIVARAGFDLAPTIRDAANHPRVILARRLADHAG
jgi:release factor glutamine methyltransferase